MLLPADEAIELIRQNCKNEEIIELFIDDPMIYGAVCAEDIFADRDMPPFNRAAVDGFAVRYDDIKQGLAEFTIKGVLTAGSSQKFSIASGECVHVMTGAPVPDNGDIMFKIEETVITENRVKVPLDGLKKYMNIAKQGEDANKGILLITTGTKIDSSVLPVIASTGHQKIKVYRRPTITLITTGDEVVPVNVKPEPWQIRDSSSYSLKQLLFHYGIILENRFLIKDNREELIQAVKIGMESDILLLTGGVSMGTTDIIPEILSNLGVKKIFHKLKIKPGKPLWFGKTESVTVFGLPGNPVSSQVGLKIFVEAYIRKFMRLPEEKALYIPLFEEKIKNHDLEEFTQAKLVNENKRTFLQPMKHHGSGDYVNMLLTDGLMIHPADKNQLAKGEFVKFYPWRSL